MRSKISSLTYTIAISLALAGCSRQAPLLVNSRVAVQIFENQTADRELNWTGSMIAYATGQRLSSDPMLAPVVVRDTEGWRELGSGRVLSGTVRQNPKGFQVEARLTDTASSRVIRTFSEAVDESALVALTGRMVESLLGTKSGDPQGNSEAWKAFAQAQEQHGVDAMASVVERFPAFAPAYPVLSELLKRSGGLEQARLLAAKLPADADASSKAQLAFSLAEDSKSKLTALKSLIALRPADLRLRAEAGAIAAANGDWQNAVEQYLELAKLEPMKPEWRNSLGYAYANLNRLPEAVAALNEYRRLLPNEPNTLDSLGEVNFMNRQFAEAARFFDEASQKFPGFQNGVSFRKAAFAFYRSGDLKSADARIEIWLKQGFAGAPPRVPAFQRAMWLARTGRWTQAQEFLKGEAEKSTGELKTAMEFYLAMMRFGMEGVRPQAAESLAFQQSLRDPGLRSEFSIFALLSPAAVNVQAMEARIVAAVPQPALAQLRAELVAAGRRILAPVVANQPRLFPLPNPLDSPLDAMLLRSQLAVIP